MAFSTRETDFGAIEIDIDQGREARRHVEARFCEVSPYIELAAGEVSEAAESRARERNQQEHVRSRRFGLSPSKLFSFVPPDFRQSMFKQVFAKLGPSVRSPSVESRVTCESRTREVDVDVFRVFRERRAGEIGAFAEGRLGESSPEMEGHAREIGTIAESCPSEPGKSAEGR